MGCNLQQVGSLHPPCMCQFEEYTNYILISTLSLLKRSKANTLAPWICEHFTLIFCRCGFCKSPWMAWSRQFWKFEIDSMIMWSCDWLRPLKDRLHVTRSGFSLSLTSPRPCYPRSFRSTRISTAHQYRKHPRYLEARVQNSKWLGCVWTPEWYKFISGGWTFTMALFSLAIVFFSNYTVQTPNLLLANKHATFLRFQSTWTSSCVRVCRLGQPRND